MSQSPWNDLILRILELLHVCPIEKRLPSCSRRVQKLHRLKAFGDKSFFFTRRRFTELKSFRRQCMQLISRMLTRCLLLSINYLIKAAVGFSFAIEILTTPREFHFTLAIHERGPTSWRRFSLQRKNSKDEEVEIFPVLAALQKLKPSWTWYTMKFSYFVASSNMLGLIKYLFLLCWKIFQVPCVRSWKLGLKVIHTEICGNLNLNVVRNSFLYFIS